MQGIHVLVSSKNLIFHLHGTFIILLQHCFVQSLVATSSSQLMCVNMLFSCVYNIIFPT